MKKYLTLLLTCLTLILNVNIATAAGYLKFDGVDGEAQDKSHDKWIDILSISPASLQPGQILIGLTKDGKRIQLTENGRYTTADGKMIIVINGKVAQVQNKKAARMPAPGSAQGFNPQPDPPKAKQGFVKPGEAKGFNPQPEPPPKSKPGFVKPGEAKGFNPQPEPPAKPLNKSAEQQN